MMYEAAFRFDSSMTISKVYELMNEIETELGGSMYRNEYMIDSNSLAMTANFDYSQTRPEAIRKWVSDNVGVTAEIGME